MINQMDSGVADLCLRLGFGFFIRVIVSRGCRSQIRVQIMVFSMGLQIKAFAALALRIITEAKDGKS